MKILATLLLGVILGFTLAIAAQSLLDAGARSKSKRTAADCRTISHALEQYRAANGHYPPIDGQIDHLIPYLVPQYLQQVPTRDMANQPFLVVLNGSEAAVISTGKYGVVVQAEKIIRGNVWQQP